MNKMTMLVMFLSLAFVGKTEARGTGVITCGLGEDEKDCPVHVLIATGYPYSNGYKTEVLDLSENPSAIPSSCSGMEDFPVRISSAVGGNVNSVPLICGGLNGYKTTNDCYKLEGKTWRKVTSGGLNVNRRGAAAIVRDQKLTIFGGIDESGNEYDSIEIIDGNGQSQDNSNNLPKAIWDHAIASINSSVAILSGGVVDGSQSRRTWFYNHATRTFSPGPDLKTARSEHASGTVIDQETNEVIPMVTGGFNFDSVKNLDSTEILLDGQWKQVASSVRQKLPKRLYGLRTVQYGNDVIAIGGRDENLDYSGSIYKFSCRSRSCAWTTLPQTLQYPRRYFVAMPINCN